MGNTYIGEIWMLFLCCSDDEDDRYEIVRLTKSTENRGMAL